MNDAHDKNAGCYVCPADRIPCHKIGRELSAGLHASGACGWLGQCTCSCNYIHMYLGAGWCVMIVFVYFLQG